jgi:hypothetical protein
MGVRWSNKDTNATETSATRRTGPRVPRGRRKIILGNLKIPIDVIPTRGYILLVLSDEGPLSRGDPSADRARAGRTGAPRNGRPAWWPGGAPGGAAPALGARGCLAARGGYVNPASKGTRWCPGASRRSIPSRGSRGWQTSDALRRENA